MRILQSGELDRTVKLSSPTKTPDATGQPVVTWTLQATVPAKVYTEHGKASMEGREQVESETMTVKIRYLSSLKPSWRVEYESEYYRIISVRELGRRQAQELKCERMGASEDGR